MLVTVLKNVKVVMVQVAYYVSMDINQTPQKNVFFAVLLSIIALIVMI